MGHVTALAGTRASPSTAETKPGKRWEIRLVGAMRMLGPNGEDALPKPKKTRALLAYLCLARPRKVSRSRLATLLWDATDAGARRNLRVALHHLERAIGAKSAQLVRLDREFVWLDPDLCAIDVAEPDQGERLLDDLDGVSELFDDWLNEERNRFEDHARAGLEAALDALLRSNAPADERLVAARKLVNFDGANAIGVNALMRALADAGEPAQALREYHRFQASYQKKWGAAPPTEMTQLYEAIRLVSSRGRTSRGAVPMIRPASPDDGGVLDRARGPSIGVLPFRNLSGDRRHDYTADGLAEDLIWVLSRVPGFFVISRLSTRVFSNQDRLPQDVGDMLNVRYLVSGNMRIASDRICATAELADAVSGVVLDCWRIEQKFSNLIDVQMQLAEEIVRNIAPRLHLAELKRLRAKRPEELTAYELFLRAQDDMHNSSRTVFDRAERRLNEAILRDPTYAAPLAWRAYLHVLRVGQGWSSDPRHDAHLAAEFARRAVECDPLEPMGYAVEGHIASYLHRDFGLAFERFEAASRLNPNAMPPRLWHAAASAWIGDGARGVEEVDRAMALSPYDPLSYACNAVAGMAYLAAGQYERAIEYSYRSLRENRTYASGYRQLVIALTLAGHRPEAEATARKLLRLEPGVTVEKFRARYPGAASAHADIYCGALAAAGIPLRD